MTVNDEKNSVFDARPLFGGSASTLKSENNPEFEEDPGDLLEEALENADARDAAVRDKDADDRRAQRRSGPRETESQDWQTRHRDALRGQAQDLKKALGKGRATLLENDRIVIVRNFGRLIERRFKGEERAVARRVFHRAYGPEGGRAKEKKRKRYIRFDGEPLPTKAPPGEYNAHGATFLCLINAYIEEIGERPDSEDGWSILVSLCKGSSFATSSVSRVTFGGDIRHRFRDYMTKIVDKLTRETDVVAYFSEVQRFPILSQPSTYHQFLPTQLAQLPVLRVLPTHFDYCPDTSLLGAERLTIDFPRHEPSSLLPAIRLARIYWPRHILCLLIAVNTTALDKISNSSPSADVIESIMKKERSAFGRENQSDEERVARVLDAWRTAQKQLLLRRALRDKSLDPRKLDWTRYLDDQTGEAINGASWYRFYQARSYDLLLVADGRPDNMRLGIYTADWWIYAPSVTQNPAYDSQDNPDPAFGWAGKNEIVTFPRRGKSWICLPLVQEPRDVEVKMIEDDPLYSPDPIENECLYHPMIDDMEDKVFDLDDDVVWNMLSMPMANWSKPPTDFGGRKRDESTPPCLRTCFSDPGWAPGSEGSLAAAMLRSISQATGPERLDSLLIEAINARVGCLERMRKILNWSFWQDCAGTATHPGGIFFSQAFGHHLSPKRSGILGRSNRWRSRIDRNMAEVSASGQIDLVHAPDDP